MIADDVFQHGIMLIDFGSGHLWSASRQFTREGGNANFKPPEFQADQGRHIPRKGRIDGWIREDFRALGQLLGQMRRVFMKSSSSLQEQEYFSLCHKLSSEQIHDWNELRGYITKVFRPYLAIESNSDILGRSDDYDKTICLPVSGIVRVHSNVISLINHDEFQRLQQVKQLSFCDWGYPGANHTRYEHSLGVFKTMQDVLDLLGRTAPFRDLYDSDDVKSALIAALTHDILTGRLKCTTCGRIKMHHPRGSLLAVNNSAVK